MNKISERQKTRAALVEQRRKNIEEDTFFLSKVSAMRRDFDELSHTIHSKLKHIGVNGKAILAYSHDRRNFDDDEWGAVEGMRRQALLFKKNMRAALGIKKKIKVEKHKKKIEKKKPKKILQKQRDAASKRRRKRCVAHKKRWMRMD
jgi:hypothetical protein